MEEPVGDEETVLRTLGATTQPDTTGWFGHPWLQNKL